MSTLIYRKYLLNRRIYFGDGIRLDGRRVIITGGNQGIGYETTKELLRRGCRVTMACRNLVKGNESMKILREETNCSLENLRLIHLDLSSFRSIETFVGQYLEEESRLDLLICNAGLTRSKEKFTEDQFDFVLQSNYLGHFYLMELLRPILSRSSPSRIIHLSSDLHHLIKSVEIDPSKPEEIFRQTSDRSLVGTYPLSKFFQIVSTNELRDDYRNVGIEMICVTPGWVLTSIEDPIQSQLPIFIRPFYVLMNYLLRMLFCRNLSKGMETILFASIDPSISTMPHFYFQNCRPSSMSKLSSDKLLARQIVLTTRNIFDKRNKSN